MFENMPYPPCPVSTDLNSDHDGGGELGPLYITDCNPSIPYACSACCSVLNMSTAGILHWPPHDGKNDFC